MAKATSPAERSFLGQTPEERKRARYEKLIAAGTQAFGQHGFRGTTVLQVCKSAGLTERYFYESFPNLAALFEAALQRASQLLQREILVTLGGAGQDPRVLSSAVVHAYLKFLAADAARAKMMLIESLANDSGVFREVVGHRNAFSGLLRTFLLYLFPWLSGAAQRSLLDGVCIGLVGATNYIAIDWIMQDFDRPLERVAESVLTIWEGMIMYANTLRSRLRRSAPESEKPARSRSKKAEPRVRARVQSKASTRQGRRKP